MTYLIIIQLICIALACWAAATDYQRREIPDSVAIGLLVAGILQIIGASPYPVLQISLSLTAAFFAGLFFLIGNQGGGDAKMIFGAVVAAGAEFQTFLVGFLVGAAIVTALAWWYGRRAEMDRHARPLSDELDQMPRQLSRNLSSPEIPFGIAIAAGVLFASAQQLFTALAG